MLVLCMCRAGAVAGWTVGEAMVAKAPAEEARVSAFGPLGEGKRQKRPPACGLASGEGACAGKAGGSAGRPSGASGEDVGQPGRRGA